MMMSIGPTSSRPATIFSGKAITLEVRLGLDADDGDRLGRLAALREARAGDDRRDADHVRNPLDLGADLLPLVDRAELLRTRLDLRGDRGRLAAAQRPRNLIGREDLDRRLVVERAADDVRLHVRRAAPT